MRKVFLVLTLCFISLILWSEEQKIEPGRFINPQVCGKCHTGIFKEWQGSMHSKAFLDPLWVLTSKLFMSQAEDEGEKREAKYCVKCHTPVGYLTGEIESTESDFTRIDPVAAQGVLCDFCHSIKGVNGIGNGSFVVEPGHGEKDPGVKRGPLLDAKSDYHQTAYSEIHRKAEFCGACHNVSHLANLTPIENTYSEWANSPYNSGDPATTLYCQDCHMRQRPGFPSTGKTERPDNPGKAAEGGPERNHIWTHVFVGGNTFATGLLGSQMHSDMARERLQNAADLEISTPDKLTAGDVGKLKIKVTNSGAGHYLPTGLTMIRQMWLKIDIADKNGQIVYQSGQTDAAGNIDPEAIVYHTILGDKAGNPVVNVAKANRVLYDNRIPPKGYREENVTFLLPKNISSPVQIRVKLNYRTAPQALVNQLLREKSTALPIIEMAMAEKTVDIAPEKE